MGKILRSLMALVLFGFTTAATATVINFSYTGVPNCAPHSCTDELTGSFAFADSPLSVGLADLTAFSLTNTFTYTDLSATTTNTYSLTDLQSFAATLDAAQDLLTLSFKTDEVGVPQGVLFTSASAPSATLEHCFVDDTGKEGPRERCVLASTGSLVTTTSVPEPSILALLLIGLGMAGTGYAGIGYERLKRRRAAHNLT